MKKNRLEKNFHVFWPFFVSFLQGQTEMDAVFFNLTDVASVHGFVNPSVPGYFIETCFKTTKKV